MFYRLLAELEKPGSFAIRETCLDDLDSPVAQHNLRYDAFPDFEPEFSPVLLSEDSSLVDFIDDGGAIGGQGLLVSARVLDILERMKLPPHRPYPLEVVHRGESATNRYFWLQILTLNSYDWIDFSRSEFRVKSWLAVDDTDGRRVGIESADGLEKALETLDDSFIVFTKLTLNGVYARSPFDLFYLDRVGGVASSYPIINDRLKAAFETEGLVGYRLSGLPHFTLDSGAVQHMAPGAGAGLK
jgi:hypothetical protein